MSQTFVVPTMLRRILDHPDFATRDVGSLKSLSYGAAPALPDLIRRAVAALPEVNFSNVFGQTETLGAYAALSPDDHRAGRKLDSVGRPFPGVEVRVVEHLYRAVNWDVASSSAEYKKTDSHTIEFPVTIASDEEKTITYTAHYSW